MPVDTDLSSELWPFDKSAIVGLLTNNLWSYTAGESYPVRESG